MKTYEVEIRRTSFITVTVEAENEEEAEAKAFEEIEIGREGYADWDMESITEMVK